MYYLIEVIICARLVRYGDHQKFVTFAHSCRTLSTVKLMSLFLACRRYCKLSGDEFQWKNKLEMIIKYIEYGLQGLDVFSTRCMHCLIFHYPY